MFALRKKMEAQQKEILSLINLTYGAEGLAEFRDIKKQIAREREDAVYRQIEMREQMMYGILILLLIGLLVPLIALIIS